MASKRGASRSAPARPLVKGLGKDGDSHVHVYNICSCGMIEPFDLTRGPGRGGAANAKDGGVFGREEVVRHGQALISKAVTAKQIDLQVQYDDDSAAVGNSMDVITQSLDALQSDIKELGRCLKSGAFAAAQLQKVQAAVGSQLKVALMREKRKMEIKDEQIKNLTSKMTRIREQQAEIKAGYERYQKVRIILVVTIVVAIVMSVLFGLKVQEDA